MKTWCRPIALLLMLLILAAPCLGAKDSAITTTPTGYTKAEDVQYLIVGGTVVNWGARGEDCTFLTSYAESYYTASYSWDVLSANDGGTGTSDAYTSPLYTALQQMMKTKHTKLQGYQDTRDYYKYTDCANNDYSLISSFYSGKTVASEWTGSTYNREHAWPRSKCINTSKKEDSADIMMLRATISSENSSRGNSAYGESSGYYDPGVSVRGDCARMVLYGYVRWGNTGKMWGSGGVMENMQVLLKWMEEDPVDTWEMGRNDAVQSITGVRNVFVDFPELAWMLFGQEVPSDMVTPSGSDTEKPCSHKNIELRNAQEASCLGYSYSGDTYCADCGLKLAGGQHGNKLGDHRFGQWMDGGSFFYRYCSVCGKEDVLPYNCVHEIGELRNQEVATCTKDGYTGDTHCAVCGMKISTGEPIPATGHLHTEVQNQKKATCTEAGYTGDTYCTDCNTIIESGETLPATGHRSDEVRNEKAATCVEAGYSGDRYCTHCGEQTTTGNSIPATGKHDFTVWVGHEHGSFRSCKVCGYREAHTYEPLPTSPIPLVVLVIAGVMLVAGSVCVCIIVMRKRK